MSTERDRVMSVFFVGPSGTPEVAATMVIDAKSEVGLRIEAAYSEDLMILALSLFQQLNMKPGGTA